jgi:hypothetical protein
MTDHPPSPLSNPFINFRAYGNYQIPLTQNSAEAILSTAPVFIESPDRPNQLGRPIIFRSNCLILWLISSQVLGCIVHFRKVKIKDLNYNRTFPILIRKIIREQGGF